MPRPRGRGVGTTKTDPYSVRPMSVGRGRAKRADSAATRKGKGRKGPPPPGVVTGVAAPGLLELPKGSEAKGGAIPVGDAEDSRPEEYRACRFWLGDEGAGPPTGT